MQSPGPPAVPHGAKMAPRHMTCASRAGSRTILTRRVFIAWSCGTRTAGRCTPTRSRRLNRLVELAGVRRIRRHDIRHTYATLFVDSGVAPKILSDRIGHSDLSVTFQVYGHRSTGHDREAAELVAELIHTALQYCGPDA